MSSGWIGLVPAEEADFRIRDDGLTFHVRPTSAAATAWLAGQGFELTREGGLAVKARDLDALIDRIEAEGFKLGPHEGEPRIGEFPGESDFEF